MNRYVISDSSGEIIREVICGDDQAGGQVQPGEMVDQSDIARRATHYLVPDEEVELPDPLGVLRTVMLGTAVPYTPEQQATKAARPRHSSVWSNATMSWSDPRTLSEVQAAQRDLIDAGRVERTFSPIEYAGSFFDADEVAMRNVAGWQTQIAAGVALPEGFVWRDAANVDHVADADFVNGLGAAITLRGTYLYAQAWALKAAIDAATTIADVEAITWGT